MSETATQELHITRVFDAPRSLVYRAFTDPDQLAQWFGPVGYSAPREEIVIEERPGGRERIVMVNDDDPSERIEFQSRYTDIVADELIAGVDTGPDGGNFRFEFHEEPGGKTRLELYVWPVAQGGADGDGTGWESSFTKLDRLIRRPHDPAEAASEDRAC
jgi:uncharacterized protein YndB with AHSA1/START domain